MSIDRGLTNLRLTNVQNNDIVVYDTSINKFVNTPASGVGEVNTGSSIGGGGPVFKQKVGANLEFRSLVAGSNVTINTGANELTINATDTGEANTGSNLAGDEGIFESKVGSDLRFKSLTAGSNITLTPSGTDITISATDTGATVLNDLTDVNIPAPIKGDIVINNGTNYVPLAAGSAGQFLTPSPLFPNGVGWVDINSFRAVAHMYFPTNFSTPLNVNITASNTWTAVTGLTQGEILNIAFAASVLTVGLSGVYQVTGACSFRVSGGSSDLAEWGISVNGANPTTATSFGGEEIGNFYVSQPFQNIIRLAAADTIQINVRNISANRDIDIGSLHYALVKVAN